MIKRFVQGAASALVLGISSTASAGLIGIFGDYNSAQVSLSSNLSNLGHTVTNLGVDINQDLSAFDSVWGVSAFNPLSSQGQSYLSDFLLGGGGVYLTGERPCCETLNSSLTTFVNTVVDGGTIQVGGQGDQGSNATINQSVVGNLANSPNNITTWNPNSSGGISGLGGVSADNIFATSTSTGGVVAAAWDMDDLVGDSGRMVLMMDVNWLSGTSQLDTLENIEVFLAGAESASVSVPEPSSIALLGLGLAGLGFSRKKKKS